MTDSAQILLDEVTSVGFTPNTVLTAGRLVNMAGRYLNGDGTRSELLTAIRIEPPRPIVGVTYTLALAVALATAKPAAPGAMYAVTTSGICPACGTRVTVALGEIANYPDIRLGALRALRCLCACEFDGTVVAVHLEPWTAHVDPDDCFE